MSEASVQYVIQPVVHQVLDCGEKIELLIDKDSMFAHRYCGFALINQYLSICFVIYI
jgi:hypothetical protein